MGYLVPPYTSLLHDSELCIQKILTNREMVNFQNFDFLRFFTIKSVTTGATLERTTVLEQRIHLVVAAVDECTNSVSSC